jgi:hydroxyacylglutathione hydrolase
MALKIITIPCLQDNYAYLIHNEATKETALVDIPDAEPIAQMLEACGWTLTDILITHHHWDHVDGLADLPHEGARIIGAAADAHRLPDLTDALKEGDILTVCGEEMHILDVSGHTIGHIAFHFPKTAAVFTADSLMAMGCGRLFEGTPEMMLASMQKFSAIPDRTLVYSGHEYTAHNASFALTLEPDNLDLQQRVAAITVARDAGRPTIPSPMGTERATNPFLRWHSAELRSTLNLPEASDAEVFAATRERRNNF